MPNYDVLIVGAGIVGTAIFESLSEAGMSCLLIESQRVGFGATGYSGAMVRLAHTAPECIAAASIGKNRYAKFDAETNGRVRVSTCGHLYFAPQDVLTKVLASVQATNSSAYILGRDEIAHRFPDMEITTDAALFEPEAGFANPVAFATHQVARGIAAGGELAEATSLYSLILNDGAVIGAQTSQGRIDCRHVVLSLGAQTPQMLSDHGLTTSDLWPQNIQVSQFMTPHSTAKWPGFVDDDLGLNGLPGNGAGGYYVGLPTGQRDPLHAFSTQAKVQHSALTLSVVLKIMTSLKDGRVLGAMCHADCYSSDLIAKIGPLDGGPEGLCLATGFSGGGFKMAPYAAKRVSEILT